MMLDIKNSQSTNLPNEKGSLASKQEIKDQNSTIFSEDRPNCTKNGSLDDDCLAEEKGAQEAPASADKRPYDDDEWGLPIQKITFEEGLILARQQEMDLHSFVRLFVVALLICCVAAVFGFLGVNIPDTTLAEGEVISALSKTETALWYGFSAFTGCLALLLPLFLWVFLARRNLATASAARTFIDVVKAVIYKYAFMMAIFWCIFKFAAVQNIVCVLAFIAFLSSYILIQLGFLIQQNLNK